MFSLVPATAASLGCLALEAASFGKAEKAQWASYFGFRSQWRQEKVEPTLGVLFLKGELQTLNPKPFLSLFQRNVLPQRQPNQQPVWAVLRCKQQALVKLKGTLAVLAQRRQQKVEPILGVPFLKG